MTTLGSLLLASFFLACTPDATDRLIVEPTEIRFSGPDQLAQVVVTGSDSSGNLVDLTHAPSIQYIILDPRIIRVDSGGKVESVCRGQTSLVVNDRNRTTTISVVVERTGEDQPVSFVADVVPLFTKHGCNSGSCHGKASGQNGFRLSLLGFEPARDFESLVREGRGRRVFPAAPGASLLLRKPTAQLSHGGGRRFPVDSVESRMLTRWIAQGMRNDTPEETALSRLEIFPTHRRLGPRATQQLRVVARLADGCTFDVTHRSQFQSNAPDLATVDSGGKIEGRGGVGEATVVARFRGFVAVALVTIPSEAQPSSEPPLVSRNLIDRFVFEKLRELGIPPSEACSDTEFVRRSSLDICGMLPDPSEVEAFLASSEPEKRSRWIDALLDRPEYADLFALKWGAILRNKRTFGPLSQPGTFAFHAWIRQALARNVPYHQFVSQILTACGDASQNPAVVWYRRYKAPEEIADDAGQLFLGLRLQCARCHHHPAEPWSQRDYYGFTAFFSRLGRKPSLDPATPRLFVLPQGTSTDPASGRAYLPRLPGGEALDRLNADEDPRQKLADWIQREDNPYFAQAVVNRYWKHFFGRGLVEPEDDFRVSNPPSHPELLDALASDFIHHGYDLKHLVRMIATSRAYDRSSLPLEQNRFDRRYFARYYSRRLPAEVLLDAINRITECPDRFDGLPPSLKAVQLPDDGVSSDFLDAFGRPKRESVCECERTSEPDLTQGLFLLGSPQLQRKLEAPHGRAARWVHDPRSDPEKIDELYQLAYSRFPSQEERRHCLAHLARRRREGKLQNGYEDLLWATINTKEFLFNH